MIQSIFKISKFLKKNICFCLLFILGISCEFAFAEHNREDELQTSLEPLFVSLGSTCEAANMLRFSQLRKFAFPFDWVVSFDGEAVIEMLENGFEDFLNDKYYVPYGPAGHLLHTRYHLEFLHDGDFNHAFSTNLEKLKQKYERRIERFKHLESYPGKIFFIRSAYQYSMTDPHRFYKFKENLEISEEYALRLYQALKFVFPKLDFDLLIINPFDGENFQEKDQIHDHVRIFQANPNLPVSKTIENYNCFFKKIINNSL